MLSLCIQFFNSYLRAAINGRDLRLAYYVLDRYRQLAEDPARAEPMRLVIFEGDDFNRLFDSRPGDVVWVNLAACGAEVDTFRDIDLSYWGFHSTTALKQLSGLDIRSNERAGMLLDERAAGFSFDDWRLAD